MGNEESTIASKSRVIVSSSYGATSGQSISVRQNSSNNRSNSNSSYNNYRSNNNNSNTNNKNYNNISKSEETMSYKSKKKLNEASNGVKASEDILAILERTSISSILNKGVPNGKQEEIVDETNNNDDIMIPMEEDEQYIYHKLSETDTIQGLSIRYRVPVAELKKENRLWRKEDMWARSILKIPKAVQMPEHIEEQVHLTKIEKQLAMEQFVEQTSAESNEAKEYMEKYKYNVKEAALKYLFDKAQESKAITIERIDQGSGDYDYSEEEISVVQNDVATHSPSKVRVRKVSNRVKRSFENDENSMFDL